MFKALLLCAVVTLVSCQTNKPTLNQLEHQVFTDLDANSDHKLTSSEFDDFLKKNDPSGDHSMDYKEFLTALKHTAPADAQKMFALYDKNDDKVLDLKDSNLVFKAFDANGDGHVTMHEFKDKYVGVLYPAHGGSIIG